MENLVPLGTGNSRLMKSNIPSNTTLAQLIQMWNNGTFPYDIGPLNSAGISQQGTPLNKDTLLKDATAALFGLGTDAVPDDVLAKLANAAFVENGGLTDVGGNSVGIQIATGSYVGTGTYGANNPNTLTFEFEPKLVLCANNLLDYAGTNQFGFMWFGQDGGQAQGSKIFSLSGNTLSWYHNKSASNQANQSGATFKYVAIG